MYVYNMLEVYQLEVASDLEVVILGVALGLGCATMTIHMSVSSYICMISSLATTELEYNSCTCVNMSVLC